jgi:hypothetical protein
MKDPLNAYKEVVYIIFKDVYRTTGDIEEANRVVNEWIADATKELINTANELHGVATRFVKHNNIGFGLNNPPLFSGTVYTSSAAVEPAIACPHDNEAQVRQFESGLEQYNARINDVAVKGVVKRADAGEDKLCAEKPLFRVDKPIFTGFLKVDSKRIDVVSGVYESIVQFKERLTNDKNQNTAG